MRKLSIRLESRRENGKNYSFELVIYIPKSILVTSSNLIFPEIHHLGSVLSANTVLNRKNNL